MIKWIFDKFVTVTCGVMVLIFALNVATAGSGSTAGSNAASKEMLETEVNDDATTYGTDASCETTEYVTDANGERTSMAQSSDSTKDDNEVCFNSVGQCGDYVVYDFAKDQYIGFTGNNVCTDFEAYAGVHTTVSDSGVLVKAYDNMPDTTQVTIKVIVLDMKDNTKSSEIDLNDSKGVRFGMSAFPNGLYKIRTTYLYTTDTNKQTRKYIGYQYVYVTNKTAYTCRAKSSIDSTDADATKEGMLKCKSDWLKVTEGIDEDEALNLNEITYPTNGADNRVVETSQWAALGKKLAANHPGASDSVKVNAFIAYIDYNVAFDNYKATVLMPKGLIRADAAGDTGHTDPDNYAYKTHVGVCWDYVNILAIMCRANDIPCTSVESDDHTFNAVYLNGHWYPFDITKSNHYQCETKNTDRSNWTDQLAAGTNKHDHRSSSAGFGEYFEAPIIETTGKQIWTYNNATDLTDD